MHTRRLGPNTSHTTASHGFSLSFAAYVPGLSVISRVGPQQARPKTYTLRDTSNDLSKFLSKLYYHNV